MDAQAIDPEIIKHRILQKFAPTVKDCHDIKTRTDGFGCYLELHVLVDPSITVREAHDVAEEIENYLKEFFR
ncbi:MAG: cation transporter dimerization domain-containing protein [Candidatus Njordarchaeales archaeon]